MGMNIEPSGTSIRVKLDKPTTQAWYNICYGIWMDAEPEQLRQQLGAILSTMLAVLNAPPRKPGMPKGYHYPIEPCHICGRPMPRNSYIQHIKNHHHEKR